MKILRIWWMSLFVLLAFTAFGTFAYAQDEGPLTVYPDTAEVGAPVMEEAISSDAPPVFSDEEIANLQKWEENTHLPGPILEGNLEPDHSSAPDYDTESVEADLINAPGDFLVYGGSTYGSKLPAGQSNIMEHSVGTGGKYVFATGNWFAARTYKGGGISVNNWQYIDPRPGFPSFSPFCCDQIAYYDASRNIYLWLRMGTPGTNPDTGNYENVFLLSVDFGEPFIGSYWTYSISPRGVNGAWTNQWFDYPHIQLGTDYVYITWNMFNSAGIFTRSVVLRFPLDALATGAGFSYNYYNTTAWSTFVPVQGAYNTMYWASNWPNSLPQNSRLGIWRWNEDSGTISFWTKTLTAWTFTARGQAVCGSPNWAARYDQRVLTGVRYTINNTNVKYYGRKVLGWWWNVRQGGDFARPYIEGAAFFEDDMTQVPGNQGRPLVWSPDYCFAYPSAAANMRQDVGMIFHFAGPDGYHKPDIAASLADDYTVAPPGWNFYQIKPSNAGPSDEVWGDYNTTRVFYPLPNLWVAASHRITGNTNCSRCSQPTYFIFGREREANAYERWRYR